MSDNSIYQKERATLPSKAQPCRRPSMPILPSHPPNPGRAETRPFPLLHPPAVSPSTLGRPRPTLFPWRRQDGRFSLCREKVAWPPVPVSKDQCPIFGTTSYNGSILWTAQSVSGPRGIVACHFSVIPVGNRSGLLTARSAPAADSPSGLRSHWPTALATFVVTAENRPQPLIARAPRMPTKGCWPVLFTCSNIASAPP